MMYVPPVAFIYNEVGAIRVIEGESMSPTLNKPLFESPERSWEQRLPMRLQLDHVVEISASLHRFLCNLYSIPYLSRGTIIILQSPSQRGGLVCKRVMAVDGDYIYDREDHVNIIGSNKLWVEGDNARRSVDSNVFGEVDYKSHIIPLKINIC